MRIAPARAALAALTMAAAAIAAVLLSGTPSASADTFYQYQRNGKLWFSNTCPVKNCKVVLRGPATSSRSTSAPSSASYSASTRAEPLPVPAAAPTPGTFDDAIARASKRYQIPAPLIRAVIRVESNFNPSAVSRAGAMGLMQLMPGTASDQGVTDRLDPEQNIMGGTRYLRWLANRFNGDIIKTLAGYHAGHGAVELKGGIPYSATEHYVKKVLGHYYRYKATVTTASLP